ncbi:hypothetical protein MNB_SV-15-1165 [hydrothermal vent metagenome]|uniref:Periplasmic nitrate reductase component NapL n=1 Tax=hydrothermal vent metagenome TaxID=652676 RepID=A0A1W1EHY5_9ZZZZ
MKKSILLILAITIINANNIIAKVPEASGICYSKSSDTLFVANDEGSVFELSLDGKILRKKKIGKYDLEGVACDEKNSNLLFVVEVDESVLVVDRKSLKVEKEIKIKRTYKNKLVLKKDKEHGIEAITIVNGDIYISNQSYKKYPNRDASIVFKISKLRRKKKSKIEDIIAHNFVDIAGLSYYKNFLYMLSDKKNLLIKYDIKKDKAIKKIKLDKFAGEGVTFDGKGNIYFADDEGSVLKYKMKKLGL